MSREQSTYIKTQAVYFCIFSNYGKEIKNLFYEKYQIPDVFDYPLCNVMARNSFIQRI